MSPFAVEIDSEVKGMLNAADRAFGLSAIVRHCSKRDDSYEVGVEFRFLRNEEADLLAANARANGDGRRHGEGVAPVVTSMEDIRSKFRRFAA